MIELYIVSEFERKKLLRGWGRGREANLMNRFIIIPSIRRESFIANIISSFCMYIFTKRAIIDFFSN